jgi:hypothetical protein
MSLGTIILIVLFLAVIGVLPAWSHSASWGYAPGGGLAILLLVAAFLVVTGRI